MNIQKKQPALNKASSITGDGTLKTVHNIGYVYKMIKRLK